jgi:hypothetical protein
MKYTEENKQSAEAARLERGGDKDRGERKEKKRGILLLFY